MTEGYLFLSLLLSVLSLRTVAQVSCLRSTAIYTLEDLMTCFQNFTVPEGYYADSDDCAAESTKYTLAQPSESELKAWSNAITMLLNVDGDKNICPGTPVDVPGIESSYTISRFDDAEGQTFCVLSEKQVAQDSSMIFARGWGTIVVPAKQEEIARSIHFSVPHPLFDGKELAPQGAALFKSTGAKSLVISGRHRASYPCRTNCLAASKSVYYRTDPTHDINEPFHTALVTILSWQNKSTCTMEHYGTFIQLHGKAVDHCGNDNMFLSGGIASVDWYVDHPTYPVNLLKKQLNLHFEGFPAIIPEDSNCDLTATRNVFARLINGVPEESVCTKSALKAQASGHLIHIEQHYAMMQPSQYVHWIDSLIVTFPDIRVHLHACKDKYYLRRHDAYRWWQMQVLKSNDL